MIDDGVTGYVSCDGDFRIDRIRALCDDPALAHRLGRNARAVAQRRFGLARLTCDWNAAFERAITLAG